MSATSVILGVFDDPQEILHAAAAAQRQGWKDLEAVTPYPIHGMEHALGIKMSWVPYVTLVMGLAGGLGGMVLAWWTSAVDWPLNVGGKPFFSWQAFVPVMFECGILIGGIGTFVALWAACRLPKSKPVVLDERLTDDQFGLVVPLSSGMREEDVVSFLKETGAHEVRRVDV